MKSCPNFLFFTCTFGFQLFIFNFDSFLGDIGNAVELVSQLFIGPVQIGGSVHGILQMRLVEQAPLIIYFSEAA